MRTDNYAQQAGRVEGFVAAARDGASGSCIFCGSAAEAKHESGCFVEILETMGRACRGVEAGKRVTCSARTIHVGDGEAVEIEETGAPPVNVATECLGQEFCALWNVIGNLKHTLAEKGPALLLSDRDSYASLLMDATDLEDLAAFVLELCCSKCRKDWKATATERHAKSLEFLARSEAEDAAKAAAPSPEGEAPKSHG